MKNKLLIIFIVITSYASAQYYIEGQNRFSLHWYQINTENFQIIFSDSNHVEAQRIANTLETIYKASNKSLNAKTKKVSIILQNQGTESNGFATLVPRRAEFYQTPSQDTEGIDWLELLCIHEYRHILQMDKYKIGLTKIISFITGEQGTGAILGMTTPTWYLEGDAVGNETALSNGGRGRLPKFEMELKAQFLDLGSLSYEKASFGSYRYNITDHYKLGYHLTTHAKTHYGTNVWDSTMTKIARQPFRLFPFSRCFKKTTGINTSQLYKNTFTELDSLWRKQNEFISENFEQIKVSKLKYNNALFPVQIDSNTYLFIEANYDNITRLCTYNSNTNTKKRLLNIGIYSGGRFSYKARKVAYTTYRNHPRWGYENFSELYIFDLINHKTKKIEVSKRAFSPALSDDASRLAFIEIDKFSQHALVIVNPTTNQEIFRVQAPQNHQWIEPYWQKNEIVFIDFTKGKSRIMLLDLGTGKIVALTQYFESNIQTPILQDRRVFASADFNGIQNIYEFKNDSFMQISACKFGGFYPSVNQNKQLVFSSYYANGYAIAKTNNLNPVHVHSQSIHYSQTMVDQEKASHLLDSIPKQNYEVTKYRKLTHLINVHSWQPFYLDPNTEKIGIGAGLFSQNVLSTTLGSISYHYLPDEKRNVTKVNFQYLGLYPTLNFTYLNESYPIIFNGNKYDIHVSSFNFSNSVPLNFYSHNFYKYLNPEISISQTNTQFTNSQQEVVKSNRRSATEISNTFYIAKYRAKKDIKSPFFVKSFVSYIQSPFDKNTASSFSSSSSIGIKTLKHHNIELKHRYQQNKFEEFTLNSYNFLPTFYTYTVSKKLNYFGIEYTLPLLYPDLKLGFIAYIQRIRANIGIEHAQNETQIYDAQYIDIIADANLLRYAYLMNIGMRFTQHPAENELFYNIILGVNF